MTTTVSRWASMLALAALAGCAPAFARLDKVLVQTRPDSLWAEPEQSGKLQVTHHGITEAARQGMAIRRGDTLRTASDGVAVVTLAAGYQVFIDPGTQLAIENPSILVRLGRVIVKKLEKVRESLKVKTDVAVAAVEGTQFSVESSAEHRTQISVVEGRVKVYPNYAARWRDTAYYTAGDRVSIVVDRVTRLPPADRPTAASIQRRLDMLSRLPVRPITSPVHLEVSPAIGIYAPTKEILLNTDNRQTIKNDVGPTAGVRVGVGFGSRFGVELTGSYASSNVHVPSFNTAGPPGTVAVSANQFYGTGRATIALLPPSSKYQVGINGGVSVIKHSGDTYANATDTSDLGGVIGATGGLRLGPLIMVYVGTELYIYNNKAFTTDGSAQRDLQVSAGVKFPIGR